MESIRGRKHPVLQNEMKAHGLVEELASEWMTYLGFAVTWADSDIGLCVQSLDHEQAAGAGHP